MATRTRVAEGIFRDKYGFDARVRVRGIARTKRFPFDTDLDKMKAWRDRTRADVREDTSDGTPVAPPTSGTLEAEAPRYLAQIEAKPSFKSDRSNLRAWVAALGTWPTSKITTEQVNLMTQAWKKAGMADQTWIHRLRVLREMYETLYGKKTPTPVAEAKRPEKPKSNPTDVPVEVINAVDAKLLEQDDPLAYAIYRVLVTTGQRASQLNRTLPKHLNMTKRTWQVLNAKGADSHIVYLNADMLKAWKLFIAADGWGKVDTSSQADKLHDAGWPEDIRPYNARHAVAFAAMDNGADISDVAALLGQDVTTTSRTYFKHQEKRMRRVSGELEGRFGKGKS
jgi:site-specific recombinase XerD